MSTTQAMLVSVGIALAVIAIGVVVLWYTEVRRPR